VLEDHRQCLAGKVAVVLAPPVHPLQAGGGVEDFGQFVRREISVVHQTPPAHAGRDGEGLQRHRLTPSE
jgi:hypothetical protein